MPSRDPRARRTCRRRRSSRPWWKGTPWLSREVIDRGDVVDEERPRVALHRGSEGVLADRRRALGRRGERVLRVVPDEAAESETDARLQRELGNADEPELNFASDARSRIEPESTVPDVRRARGLRFTAAREADVDLGDEEELVVLAVRERDRKP